MIKFLPPLFFALLAGCVNLHVHFPEAPAEKAAAADASSRPAEAPAGAAK